MVITQLRLKRAISDDGGRGGRHLPWKDVALLQQDVGFPHTHHNACTYISVRLSACLAQCCIAKLTDAVSDTAYEFLLNP